MKYEEIKERVKDVIIYSQHINELKAAYNDINKPTVEIVGITFFSSSYDRNHGVQQSERKFSTTGNLKELFMKALEDELSRSVMRKEQLIQELEGEDYMRPTKKAKRR